MDVTGIGKGQRCSGAMAKERKKIFCKSQLADNQPQQSIRNN
jgi:hypothetical protein